MAIERALHDRRDIRAEFLHLPPPGTARRLLAAPVPGLARLDLDFQPLRLQLATAALARRLLQRRMHGVDVVHIYTQNVALTSVDLLRCVPTVVTVDSTNALNAFRLPYRLPTRFTRHTLALTKVIERRVYDAATIIVANSRWASRSLIDDYDVPESKIRVFPLGISLPETTPERLARSTPRITFVGRSMERKGGRRLLELHQRYLKQRCILTLVTQEAVKPGVANVELRNDVTPANGKLASILANTDIFVLPSTIDMSPNAILEAMAAAVPVVAFSVGGVPEMLEDRVTGRLVAEGDDDGLVKAIASMLDDLAGARAMGQRGRDAVSQRFDAIQSTARLLDVLGEAVRLYADSGGPRR
jgi:starch synthase